MIELREMDMPEDWSRPVGRPQDIGAVCYVLFGKELYLEYHHKGEYMYR